MKPKILLLAGEESGVLYAGRLSERLHSAGADVRGYADYGFATSDLAVMGFWPVLRRIFYFLGVAHTMKRAIREWRPDAVVTIDYPGMNLKLAAYAKGLGIPAVHMVCPQVWAWHRNRIPKVAAALSELLCFFPFEPELFRGTGLEAKFIGHPLVKVVEREFADAPGGEKSGTVQPADPADDSHDVRTVALLPGSRIGEIQRILPRLLDAVSIMSAAAMPPFRIVIPAANGAARREIERIVGRRTDLPKIEVQSGNARALLRTATCAAVASGTATLEAALARCPTVLVYAVSPLLAWFARRVITGVRHIGLANVVAEKCGFEPPMPELLQEAFTAEAVAARLKTWLSDAAVRRDAVEKLDAAMRHLKADGEPLDIAAAEIMSKIGQSSRCAACRACRSVCRI